MRYFLGVDAGGSKTHAAIASEDGQVAAFASGGTGSWEAIGYDRMAGVLQEVTRQALDQAGLEPGQLSGAGFGLSGYDWPSQKAPHLKAISRLGLACPVEIVNDAVLGILAGSPEGWGVSVVSGTGCNCRGWSKDRTREGRVVGGATHWSSEAAGAFDIVLRAMRAVAFQWNRRGPDTALTELFLAQTGAASLDDLIEGMYVGRYRLHASLVRQVFETAHQGDPQAQEVIRWAGDQLGQLAAGVIRQLDLKAEVFDVVLIGSLFGGHPLLSKSLGETVHQTAPYARMLRLEAPPVVGAVLLGMEAGGLPATAGPGNISGNTLTRRERLLATIRP